MQARSDGFVEKVYPLTIGDHVKKGTPLIDITIPEWVEAQSEFLLLSGTGGTSTQIKGVLERLRLAGMPEEDIQRLRSTRTIQTRFTIKAPIDGVITAFDLRTGMNISKDKVVAQIKLLTPQKLADFFHQTVVDPQGMAILSQVSGSQNGKAEYAHPQDGKVWENVSALQKSLPLMRENE